MTNLTPKAQEQLLKLLEETQFEIWNAGCTHRLTFDGELINICTYHDPLHPIKSYKLLNSALKYLEKLDEGDE